MNANCTVEGAGAACLRMLQTSILVLFLYGSALHAQANRGGPTNNSSVAPVSPNAAGSTASQQRPPIAAGTSSASDEDLKHAQRDELDAERKYYQAQTANIVAKQPLWLRLAPVITPVGALLAALAALGSFLFNYRTTLRNQQDTQFFEALKRFGDKDSPSVRASAAGLLAELGTRPRFLRTSLNQLTVGLLLEENPVVLEAIRAALLKLMELESGSSLRALREQNLTLQKELALALTDFLAAESPEQKAALTDEVWEIAAAVSGFRPLVLRTLVGRVETLWLLGKTPFLLSLEDARLRRPRGIADSATVAESLRKTATRLRSNVTVLSEAVMRFHKGSALSVLGNVFLTGANFGVGTTNNLRMEDSQLQDITCYGGLPNSVLYHSEFQGADFYSAHLEGASLFGSGFEGARLRSVDLRNANLQSSRLDGTLLYQCKMDGAKLYGVRIDETTEIHQSNWWAADFVRDGQSDDALLTKLHDRVLRLKRQYEIQSMFGDEIDLTNWLDKAHPSVKAFVAARQGQQHP